MPGPMGLLDSVLTFDIFSHKYVNTIINPLTMNLSSLSSASEQNSTMINIKNTTEMKEY
jgi:hypothetical protein